MAKNYRTVQQWNHWLAQELGDSLLAAEKKFLSTALAERYGKHVLLIGVPQQVELLKCSAMSHPVILTPLMSKHKQAKWIESEYYNLPIVPSSVDLVIVPHLLEFLDNPRQLLIEACRAVKPEGFIMIFGFNPLSLWGVKKWWVKNKNMPWAGTFLQAREVKNWLQLADFELIQQDMLLFRPPIVQARVYQRLRFLEWLGPKLCAPFGGIYVLTAQAKTIPLTSIKLHWKQKLSALHATIPRPTLRDTTHGGFNIKIFIFLPAGAFGVTPGRGGWGALLRYDKHEKKLSGAESNTTNNRMELMAAIKALESLTQGCGVELYTDSQYVQKGVTEWLPAWKRRNWKKADNKPVKNADLWMLLDKQKERHMIRWHWVKGHNGHVENELVDRLANQAIDNFLK